MDLSIVGHVGRAAHLQIKNFVEELREGCFAYHFSLLTVTFDSDSRLRRIGAQAFSSCWHLKSIAIPASVETLDVGCFSDSSSLSVVTFGSGSRCSVIGETAFRKCRALTAISLPSSLERLGSFAFQKCESLGIVVIRSGSKLCFIGESPFEGCALLKSLQIPSSHMDLCRHSRGSEGPFVCALGGVSEGDWISRIRVGSPSTDFEYAMVEEE
jgi:hypothetical protein